MPRPKADATLTPTPDTPGDGPPAAAETPGGAQQRSVELLRAAREALDTGDADAGLALLEDALLASPDDELLRDVVSSTLERSQELRLEQAVRHRAEAVKLLLDRGLLDQAEAALGDAVAELGERRRLSALAARIESERLELWRREEAEELIARAVELAARDAVGPALEVLGDARRLGPPADIAATIRGLEERLAEQIDESRHGRGLETAVSSIEELLDEGDLGEARRALDLATKLYPDERRLGSLAARLGGQEAKRLRERLEKLLATARDHLHQGRFDHAVTVLEDALVADPDNEEASAMLAETRRREAVGSVEAHLADGRFDDARRAVDVAARLLGDDPVTTELRARIDDTEEQGRSARIDVLVAAARAATRAGRLERAVSLLQQAGAIDPANPWVQGLLRETRLRQAEESIELSLMVGDTAGARRALDVAEKIYPEEVRLALLRRRLEEGEAGA